MSKITKNVSSHFRGKACLADSTGADEGHNPIRAKAILQQLHRIVSANQAAISTRKVGGRLPRLEDRLADDAGIRRISLPNTPAAKQPITSPGCCFQHSAVRAERLANCGNMDLQGILFDGN